MSEPYVVRTTKGYCGGCGERLGWFAAARRWAHRRCAMTLLRHRQPFVTKDGLSALIDSRFRRGYPAPAATRADLPKVPPGPAPGTRRPGIVPERVAPPPPPPPPAPSAEG